jgi:hypothetical protein
MSKNDRTRRISGRTNDDRDEWQKNKHRTNTDRSVNDDRSSSAHVIFGVSFLVPSTYSVWSFSLSGPFLQFISHRFSERHQLDHYNILY